MAKQQIILTLNVDASYSELIQELSGTPGTPPDLAKSSAVIRNILDGVCSGAKRSVGTQMSVTIGGPGSAVAATKTVAVTFASLAVGDVLQIGSEYFTAVASGATGKQFNLDTDSATTATSLRAAINADTACLAAATGAAANVILTAKTTGPAGNNIVLFTSKPTGLTFTGLALAGGLNAAVTYTLLS